MAAFLQVHLDQYGTLVYSRYQLVYSCNKLVQYGTSWGYVQTGLVYSWNNLVQYGTRLTLLLQLVYSWYKLVQSGTAWYRLEQAGPYYFADPPSLNIAWCLKDFQSPVGSRLQNNLKIVESAMWEDLV